MQRRPGAEIPADHPINAWLVSHTCLLITAMVRGEDGLTAWARARGRPSRQRLMGVAESCLYKLPLDGPQHDSDGNMAPRWGVGTSLGYNHDANSYVLWKEESGTTTSRAVLRRPVRVADKEAAQRCGNRKEMAHMPVLRRCFTPSDFTLAAQDP